MAAVVEEASADTVFDQTLVDPRSEDLEDQLRALCKRVLGEVGGDPGWAAAAPEDVEVKRISGGITNILCKLGPRTGDEENPPFFSVLARVFGKAVDVVCDRAAENVICVDLGRTTFGPKIHAVFGNGRLEEWLVGRRPLEPLEMLQTEPADLVSMNARKLAEMHETCSGKVKLDLWSQLEAWVKLGEAVSFPDDAVKTEKFKKMNPYPRFREAFDKVFRMVPSPANGNGAELLMQHEGADRRAREILYETKFCHMDLLSGNIMYSEKLEDVKFIDFEYAMNSWVGLDIANHFNAVPESCLILEDTFDVAKYYPKPDVQRRFLKAYLEGRKIEGDDGLIEAMLKVIMEFSLLAELRWCIWSVVQAKESPVDFDYFGYGILRFEQGFLEYMKMHSEMNQGRKA